MFRQELVGQQYNKSDHRRHLAKILEGRSDGAIELKHENISAVLFDLNLPFIEGYKPLGNLQQLLARAVVDYLDHDPALVALMETVADRMPAVRAATELAEPDRQVTPPEPVVREKPSGYVAPRSIRQIDFTQRDAANRKLGHLGEQFILEIERNRLSRLGRDDLARRVHWTAHIDGDGAGYDIQSFEPGGREVFIEVKTTNWGKPYPFLVTRNEIRVSEEKADQFRLFRVFSFTKDAHFYVLPGSIRGSCLLTPTVLSAVPGKPTGTSSMGDEVH